MEWITDTNGNRCSVEYFGTREAAQAALDSLKNCRDCKNCYGCSGCSGCSDLKNARPIEDTAATLSRTQQKSPTAPKSGSQSQETL